MSRSEERRWTYYIRNRCMSAIWNACLSIIALKGCRVDRSITANEGTMTVQGAMCILYIRKVWTNKDNRAFEEYKEQDTEYDYPTKIWVNKMKRLIGKSWESKFARIGRDTFSRTMLGHSKFFVKVNSNGILSAWRLELFTAEGNEY